LAAEDRLSTHKSRHIPDIVLVLAGGLGKRLRPVVSDRPKVLAPVAGKPFLGYVLEYIADQGIHQVILCVGYLADQVKAFARDGKDWGLEIRYSEEIVPLGTGGAVRQVSGSINGPFFVMNGDTLFLANLQALWQMHITTRALATLALLSAERGEARGCVTLDPDGKIVSFEEKPDRVGQAFVNAGIYILEYEALEHLRPGENASLERQVFPGLAAQGRLAGNVQAAYFTDIGTPESLAVLENDVLAGMLPFFGGRVKE